jgi:hypothetical protein
VPAVFTLLVSVRLEGTPCFFSVFSVRLWFNCFFQVNNTKARHQTKARRKGAKGAKNAKKNKREMFLEASIWAMHEQEAPSFQYRFSYFSLGFLACFAPFAPLRRAFV